MILRWLKLLSIRQIDNYLCTWLANWMCCQIFIIIQSSYPHYTNPFRLHLHRVSLFDSFTHSACPRFLFCVSNWLQGPEQIHVSKFYKESKNGKFVSYITENVRTLYQTFREGAYASNNGPCLGWRETLTSPYQVSFMHIRWCQWQHWLIF